MKINLKHLLLLVVMIATSMPMHAADQFVNHQQKGFVWIANGKALPILVDEQEEAAPMDIIISTIAISRFFFSNIKNPPY